MKRTTLLLLTCLFAGRALAIGAGAEGMTQLSLERCRQLVEAGAILSMMELMARVEALSGGQLLDSVLLQSDDDYIYELEVAGIDGVVRMLYVDARTGVLVDF
ncbi:PepSY domain-containing protein [Marinobacterium aestuariivivens]|uniref:PepSY domain-containing protein n=1 Tax=Marinobacterium aestuariivivens TaxID=1698799 RepID=A0ABW1ZYJ0_9GAMM